MAAPAQSFKVADIVCGILKGKIIIETLAVNANFPPLVVGRLWSS